MLRLIYLIAGWLARLCGISLKAATGIVAAIGSAVIVLLPIAIYNATMYIAEKALDWIISYYGQSDGIVIEITGLAGWFANNLNLPQILSLVLSACSIRITVKIMLAVL